MSTPAFVAQGLSTLSQIRYYTAFDPYFYTVDNRPLQDIETNLVKLGSQGADSARRAALVNQLGTSTAYSSMFPLGGTYSNFMTGLPVTLSGNTLTIGAGAVYFNDVINSGISTQVMKQAILVTPQVFTLTSPGASLVKNVLIQAELRSLTETNMASSTLPFLDATNPLLGCILMNHELVITIKEGADATLGNQVTPTVDSGKVELFVLTYNSTVANSTLALHANGPSLRGADKNVVFTASNTLADSTTTALTVPVSLREVTLSPLKPIQLQVRYSSSVASNALMLKVEYRSIATGGLVNAALSSAGTQAVTAPGTANALASATLTSATIPASAFSGWSSNKWSVTADMLNVVVSRLGADAGDTNTGTMTIHEVRVFQ